METQNEGLPPDGQGAGVFELTDDNAELLAAMQADADATPGAGVTLDEIMALAHRQIELEADVAAAEAVLKQAVAKLNDVMEDKLPDLMQGLGMTSLELEDGAKVTLKEDLKVSLAKAKKPAGFTWLRDAGHGSIIKNVVSVPFGKGEEVIADHLFKRLRTWKYAPERLEEVNANTLKALIKEQKGKGVDIPEETFTMYPYVKTVIKQATGKENK